MVFVEMHSRFLLMAALMGLVSLNPLGQAILSAVLPALGQGMGEDYAHMQLTLTVYLVATAVGQAFYGPISDRFGRRLPLIVGTVVFIFASIGSAFAWNIESLLAFRVLQALGGGVGMVLGRAIVRDIFSSHQAASALGYVATVAVVAPMTAPLVGSLLYEAMGGLRLFNVVALWGGVILAGLIFFVPETRAVSPMAEHTGAWERYMVVLRSPVFRLNAAIVCLCTASYYAFLAAAPFIATEVLGRTPTQYGILFIAVGGGYAIGNLLTGILATRLDGGILLKIGAIIVVTMAIFLMVVSLTDNLTVATFFIPLTLYHFAHGFIMPACLARTVGAVPSMFGTASSLCGFAQAAFGALMNALVGYAVEPYPATLGISMFLSSGLVAALIWLVLRRERAARAL